MSIYETKGFKNREDYLKKLAEVYNIKMSNVKLLADDILRCKEDLDALPSLLEFINANKNSYL